ncbi:MAG TPA: type II toxin-antitoxin system Phd/YefM family antitoxin [Pyrinomonadaceae bacterium]|nr:type II toxin-antitoxin system Phd/YefM family antitoxin [Pyrinomonadaceae bacterium]
MMYATMRNIIPITDLQRQAGQIIGSLNDSEEPIVVTQRGRASAVIISAERYSEIEADLKRLDELELLEMVELSRQEKAEGKILSHDEVKKRLKFPIK